MTKTENAKSFKMMTLLTLVCLVSNNYVIDNDDIILRKLFALKHLCRHQEKENFVFYSIITK